MFIKLTRLDNSPIWINASFVVTVEPRRGGGAVVVPIGDGLDYDVRESPESVLSLLGDAPAPAVVPVPAPKGLTQTPEDVSPEPEPAEKPEPRSADGGEGKPAKKATRSRKAKRPVEGTGAEPVAADGAEGKPAKKATRSHKAKKSPESLEGEGAAEAAAAKPEPAASTEPPLAADQIERLRKMAPGSVRKLKNTLVTQFYVGDTEAIIRQLVQAGVLSVNRDHVNWVK